MVLLLLHKINIPIPSGTTLEQYIEQYLKNEGYLSTPAHNSQGCIIDYTAPLLQGTTGEWKVYKHSIETKYLALVSQLHGPFKLYLIDPSRLQTG